MTDTSYQPSASDERGSPERPAADVVGGELTRRSRARAVAIGALAVLVVVLAGGAAVAARLLGNGGAQPESALPASAVLFAKIDLDPTAAQKVDAFRFLNKFPALKDKTGTDEDLLQQLFDAAGRNGALKGVDYAHDVEPWLGKRAAVAVLPGTGSSVAIPVVAVQVTDPDAARVGLGKLHQAAGTGVGGFVVGDEYALIAQDDATARAAAEAAAKAPLGADKGFTADMRALGDPGIAAAWGDLARIADLERAGLASTGSGDPEADAVLRQQLDHARGHLAVALRFAGGDSLELAGRVTGGVSLPGMAGTTVHHIGELPATTVAALSIDHADVIAGQLVDEVAGVMEAQGTSREDALADLAAQMGLFLPQDAKAFVGRNLLLALDGAGLTSTPAFGMRTVSDPAAASAVFATIQADLDRFQVLPTGTIAYDEVDDGIVLASTPAYEQVLAHGGGGLGKAPRFTAAVPEADSAQGILYVDIATLLDRVGNHLDLSPDVRKNLEPIAALGLTGTSSGDGAAQFSLRITTR